MSEENIDEDEEDIDEDEENINEDDKVKDQINIRVTKNEKKLIQKEASARGFRSMSAFIMWLVYSVSKKDE